MLSEIGRLETSAHGGDIQEIRVAVGKAVIGIEASVMQIQRGNQVVIAQLRDEIRTLHQQFEQERKALYTDRASGAWNRSKIDTHLDNMLRQNQPFSLLLVSVRNFKRLESQYSCTVVEGTLKALINRFAALTGEESIVGRWTEDQFLAVLDIQPGHGISLSAEATRKLSGSYSVQENGLAKRSPSWQRQASSIFAQASMPPSLEKSWNNSPPLFPAADLPPATSSSRLRQRFARKHLVSIGRVINE